MYKKLKNPDGTDSTLHIIKYKDANGNLINHIGIPINEENRDYQDYLEWVAAGNTIEEAA